VKVKSHAEFERILAAMKRAERYANPWTGTIFRSAPPKWAAGPDMLAGVGSLKSGARFNAPGSFPAVYGSSTPELAMSESLAYQRRAGLPVEQALPLVFKAISVKVMRLFDLTEPATLDLIGLTAAQLRAEPWWIARAHGQESLTQAVGRAAYDCRIQAIAAPSAHATDHGHNIVVFPDHLRPPSRIDVLRRRPN
jgi:RES domain-containing protein